MQMYYILWAVFRRVFWIAFAAPSSLVLRQDDGLKIIWLAFFCSSRLRCHCWYSVFTPCHLNFCKKHVKILARDLTTVNVLSCFFHYFSGDDPMIATFEPQSPLDRWRQRLGSPRQRRSRRRPLVALSYLTNSPVVDGLIDVEKLDIILLHDEPLSPG